MKFCFQKYITSHIKILIDCSHVLAGGGGVRVTTCVELIGRVPRAC